MARYPNAAFMHNEVLSDREPGVFGRVCHYSLSKLTISNMSVKLGS